MSTERAHENVIDREECPHCGEEPDTVGLQHLFSCPGKLNVTHGQGTVTRRYVSLDAVLEALRERGEFACGGFEKEAAAFLEAEFGVPQPEQPA